MKLLGIVLFVSLAASISLRAQPILNSSNFGPVPGIAYLMHSGGQQIPPVMGSNVTWDYANAIFSQEGTPVTLGIPDNTALGGPTVTEVIDSDIYIYFYSLDTTGYYLTGRWCEPADAFCSAPVMEIPFPFTMGVSSTSSFHCYGHEVGLPFSEDGEVWCMGVGYGTLNLPYGSMDSVLLVHRTEYLQHQTTDWHSPIQFNYASTLEQFLFVKPGTRVPLLRLDVFYEDQDTIYSSYLMEDYGVGIHGSKLRTDYLELFPNPNTGHFTVEFNDPLPADSFYSVYNAMGQLLFQRPLAKGLESEEVDLSRFGKGTYLVRVTGRDGVCNERVVVQ